MSFFVTLTPTSEPGLSPSCIMMFEPRSQYAMKPFLRIHIVCKSRASPPPSASRSAPAGEEVPKGHLPATIAQKWFPDIEQDHAVKLWVYGKIVGSSVDICLISMSTRQFNGEGSILGQGMPFPRLFPTNNLSFRHSCSSRSN